MLKLKEQYRETIVVDPATRIAVPMAFVDAAQYPRFAKHFPDFFEAAKAKKEDKKVEDETNEN